jgi:hypothetical protein
MLPASAPQPAFERTAAFPRWASGVLFSVGRPPRRETPVTDTYEALKPELVRAPRGNVPAGARLVRLRLPDRPGSLAGVTERFAAHRVDVLRLEVVAREDGFAVDDFLVSGPGLQSALADLRPDVLVLAERENVDLPDPGLAMAAACASVTFADNRRGAYTKLVEASLGLVFAEAGFVCIREPHDLLRPVASTVPKLPVIDGGQASLLHSALHSGASLSADGRVPWAPSALRDLLPGGAVAVVPGGESSFVVLTLVRRDEAPFVEAELARLAALVTVATGTLQLHDANVALARRHRAPVSWYAARP